MVSAERGFARLTPRRKGLNMANRNRTNASSTATAARPTSARRAVSPNLPVKVEAPKSDASPRRAVTREMIAARAYELWKMRGGDAEQNWLEAEQLLRNGM